MYKLWERRLNIIIIKYIILWLNVQSKLYISVRTKFIECSKFAAFGCLQRFADDRIGKTSEVMQGIRTIKMLAWEEVSCKRVQSARRKELKMLFRGACFRSLATFVNNGVPITITLVVSQTTECVFSELPLISCRY